MHRSRIATLGILVLSIAAAACGDGSNAPGGGSGGKAGLAAARAKLDGKPTGSLDADSAGRLVGNLDKDTAAGQTGLAFGPGGGGSAGDVGTQGLRILGVHPLTTSTLETCADVEANKPQGNCSCSTGQMKYDIPNIAALKNESKTADVDISLSFEKCEANGHTLDGILQMQLSAAKGDMLVVMNLSIDASKTTLAFAIKNGELWYSEDVDTKGQYVLVKLGGYAEGDGAFKVYAKNGEFDCDLSKGSGTCTSEGGEMIEIEGKPTNSPEGTAAEDP